MYIDYNRDETLKEFIFFCSSLLIFLIYYFWDKFSQNLFLQIINETIEKQ